jgi:hypothetical protein
MCLRFSRPSSVTQKKAPVRNTWRRLWTCVCVSEGLSRSPKRTFQQSETPGSVFIPCPTSRVHPNSQHAISLLVPPEQGCDAGRLTDGGNPASAPSPSFRVRTICLSRAAHVRPLMKSKAYVASSVFFLSSFTFAGWSGGSGRKIILRENKLVSSLFLRSINGCFFFALA